MDQSITHHNNTTNNTGPHPIPLIATPATIKPKMATIIPKASFPITITIVRSS